MNNNHSNNNCCNINHNILKLSVRGTQFNIDQYIIFCVPLFQVLNETKSTDNIELIEISPTFLTHLIHFYVTDQKCINFKKILDRYFEKDTIQTYFKYLGIDKIYDKMYSRKHMIDGKKIIYRSNRDMYELSDGSSVKISSKELVKTLFWINEIIIEDRENYICVKREINIRNSSFISRYYILKSEIISDMNLYFVPYTKYKDMTKSFESVWQYNLENLNNLENRENL